MVPAAVTPYNNRRDIPELLVITSSAEINGSLFADAIVQMDCSVHVRGSVTGSLTIELGADVLVDGSIYGKIINRGGRLVVKHKGLTACSVREGPPESDVGATLKINLTAIGFNWESLAKSTDADCAAVLECNAYGCGIDRVADALAKSGCRISLSPILPRPGAFAPRRRMPRSTFFMGCMLAPRAGLQSLTRNLSSTAQSSSPNGTLSPARTDGRAAVRLTSTPARTGSDFRWRRRPTFPDGSAF